MSNPTESNLQAEPLYPKDNRFPRIAPYAVEHGGLILLALLICGIVYLAIPDRSWLEPCLGLIWGLVGVRVFFKRIAGPKGRWVPRGWSLVVACFILFAYLSRRDWIGFLHSYHSMHVNPWTLVTRPLFLGCVTPVLLWFHLRAVGRRTGSFLLGWLLGFLFLAYLPLDEVYTPSIPHLALGRSAGDSLLLFNAAYVYWIGERVFEAWGLVTILEFVIVMKFWRRRPFRGLRMREWECSLPFAVALLGVPFAVMRLASLVCFSVSIEVWSKEKVLFLALIPAILLALTAGFWLGGAVLPRDPSGKRSRRDLALLAVGAFLLLVPYGNAFLPRQSPFLEVINAVLIWGFCVVAALADWETTRKGMSDEYADATEREERAGMAELGREALSPSLSARSRWGRYRLLLGMPVVWAVILGIAALTVPLLFRQPWFPARMSNLFINTSSMNTRAIKGSSSGLRTVQLFVVLLFVFCVALPGLVLIPWRIAARFHRVWNPARLRDAWMASVPAWRIFWNAILPAARGLLLLVVTSSLLLIVCLVVVSFGLIHRSIWLTPGWPWGMRVALFHRVLVFIGTILFSLGVVFLVIGFSRRKGYRGPAAYGLAVICQVLFSLGLLALHRYFYEGRSILAPVAAAFALWFLTLGRWAFSGVPEAVQRMAGE